MAKREKIRPESIEPQGSDIEAILGLRSIFRKPHYLNISAWTEHVPFAFWIVEALRPRVLVELGSHYGVSYFAFCQAVDQLGLGTRCHAVDTWKGDDHAGFYDGNVFATVKAHNAAHYSAFSQLIRATFDDTLPYFADGSIDLLHIDGLHTLDAVRHDFEAWLPKMSDRGVILLHDTNVRERGFGVHLLMDELRARFPVFEFMHCHGLGVVVTGTDMPEPLRALMRAGQTPEMARTVAGAFARLGEGCFLSREATLITKRAETAEAQARDRKARIDDMTRKIAAMTEAAGQTAPRAELEALDAQIKTQEAEITRLQTAVDDAETRLRDEGGRLAESQSALAQKRAEADETDAALTALREEMTSLQAKAEALRQSGSEHEAEAARLAADLIDREANIDERFREIATLSRRIIDLESRPQVSETEIALRAEIEALQHKLSAAKPKPDMREVRRLRGLVLQERSRIGTLEKALTSTRSALGKANKAELDLRKSTSWKITAPLRAVIRALRGR